MEEPKDLITAAEMMSDKGYELGNEEDYKKFVEKRNQCYCYNCNKDRTVNGFPYVMTRMILCPICGNKRCPHSTDHNLACTNSNEPNQPGSRY